MGYPSLKKFHDFLNEITMLVLFFEFFFTYSQHKTKNIYLGNSLSTVKAKTTILYYHYSRYSEWEFRSKPTIFQYLVTTLLVNLPLAFEGKTIT